MTFLRKKDKKEQRQREKSSKQLSTKKSGEEADFMSELEKLQKIIQATIAAGYQIDSEAFEFLNTICLVN